MDELISELSKKTGIPPAQAKQAAEFVVNFLKDKLPAPIASQIDSALKGGAAGNIAGMASQLGGMFGNKG